MAHCGNQPDALDAASLADDNVLQALQAPRIPRDGNRSATDGPFAETKEHLGGSS